MLESLFKDLCTTNNQIICNLCEGTQCFQMQMKAILYV